VPFFGTSWDVGVLNSAIFNIFHNRVEFGTILKGLRNFGVGGVEPPPLGTPLLLCGCVTVRLMLMSCFMVFFLTRRVCKWQDLNLEALFRMSCCLAGVCGLW